MKDLFLKTEIEKIGSSAMKISPRASDWGRDVLNRFYSDYPELSNMRVTIKFKQKDDNVGYGIGAVRVGELALPVIINQYHLFPLDVAITSKGVVPFTKETIQMLLSSKAPFSQLSKEEEPDAFIRFFDSPYGYGPGYAMEKGGEWKVLSEIEKNAACSLDFKTRLAECIVKDPILMEKIENNPILKEGLQKISEMVVFEKTAFFDEIEYDIHYIYENEDGTFTKMAGNSLIEVEKVEKGLEKYQLGTSDNILASPGDKIAAINPKYTFTEGYVYKLANDEDLFVTKEGNYRILVGKDRSFTKSAAANTGNLNTLVGLAALPSPGDKGFLFDPETEEIKTSIIEMRKVAFVKEGLKRLEGEFSVGAHLVKFATLRGLHDARNSVENDTLYVPERWVFAKLEEELPNEKLAEVINPQILDLNCVRCIGIDHYDFRGPVLKKYAEKKGLADANRHEVAFSILQCGGSVEDVDKVASLSPGNTYVVKSTLRMPITVETIEKTAEKLEDESTGTDEFLFDMQELLKIAAEMGAKDGVDAVLGSAFLKKDTLGKFVDMIPLFEEVTSNLGKLLVYTRMGADSIEEEPVRRAMHNLSTVIYQLYGVRNMSKK